MVPGKEMTGCNEWDKKVPETGVNYFRENTKQT
jgi:hypothetical protein